MAEWAASTTKKIAALQELNARIDKMAEWATRTTKRVEALEKGENK